MSGKYYTLWSKPCLASRKTISFGTDDVERAGSKPATRRLTAVKETLYNPMLPTLRRMDMDEILKKLPEKHSRFMTPLSKGEQNWFSIIENIIYFMHYTASAKSNLVNRNVMLVFNVKKKVEIEDQKCVRY